MSHQVQMIFTLTSWILLSAGPSCCQEIPTPSIRNSNKAISILKSEIDSLIECIDQILADDTYIVIDTMHNRLQIRREGRVLSEATCATGSGKVLLGPKRKSWRFNTPKGVFTIQRKVEDPIWAKPEWAFVEKGESAPVLPWAFNRLDPFTLGKYALELGDGYEIHGTLYPHLLGRHITHGCIRLNDPDLNSAYLNTTAGNKVYIY
jgi:L,D-transpeptidase ErfK/SrfK